MLTLFMNACGSRRVTGQIIIIPEKILHERFVIHALLIEGDNSLYCTIIFFLLNRIFEMSTAHIRNRK